MLWAQRRTKPALWRWSAIGRVLNYPKLIYLSILEAIFGRLEMTKNQFGLPRPIPEEVKRQVRERCGFGCVSCGRGIFQYDHFDPEYSEAHDHLPEGITLLCGSCHDEKKHGLLTNDKVAEMNADPFCKSEVPLDL